MLSWQKIKGNLSKIINKLQEYVWFDLIDLTELQCCISVVLTIFIYFISSKINLYEIFITNQEELKNLFLELMGAFIGLLGFTISGIAIITALFSKENVQILNSGKFKKIFARSIQRFYFLTILLAIFILELILIYICIISDKPPIAKQIFNCLFMISAYLFVFTITYSVGFVKQIISLYNIKNKLDAVSKYEHSIFEEANEIRVDFLMMIILEKYNYDYEDAIRELIRITNESEYPEKEEIIKYFKKHY